MDIHGDVHVNDDGTIDMNTPFEMFGGDRLYAKNGEVNFSIFFFSKNGLKPLIFFHKKV